jgi:hypothetical protein
VPDASDAQRAIAFARDFTGTRYVFGGCSRSGADCSGYMSILINVINDRANPFVRLFGTGNIAQLAASIGLKTGSGGPEDFRIGVMYPHESSSGIGHTAGTLPGGINVEERGGAGALIGANARGYNSPLFGHHFHLPISSEQEWFDMPIGVEDLQAIQKQATDALQSTEGQAALSKAIAPWAEQVVRRTVYAVMTGGIGAWSNPEREGWDWYGPDIQGAALRHVRGHQPRLDEVGTALAEQLQSHGITIPADVDPTTLAASLLQALGQVEFRAHPTDEPS